MVKQFIPAIAVVAFLASCSSLKPLNFTSSKQVAAVAPSTTPPPEKKLKFIEDIAVTPDQDAWSVKPKPSTIGYSSDQNTEKTVASKESEPIVDTKTNRVAEIESATKTQLKYAVLLNTEVESLPNKYLLESVDEWYGVRYRVGGNTTKGVDCSGFTVAVYAAVYGIMLPRVSREQFRTSRRISTTELKEGDLVFFDTRFRGSVSHVGVYLGNNKFAHASVSKGVMVNDLFEPYYLKRFVGAGRIDNKSIASSPAGTH